MADNTNKEKVVISFDTNANEATRDVNKLSASIEQTTESVQENTKATDQQDQAYKNLKTQLREANIELQKSIQIYGETSEQAVKAAKGVAELKDQIGFAQDLTEQFNPDQKFKALGAATQLAATGMQGATAAMGLFGDSSEQTEAMLLKVQSAMAFSDAISSLSDLGDQWALLKTTIGQNAIATKANTAATGAAAMVTKLFGGAVDTNSKSFKGLKLAIAGTGIGLLVVGVAALINNFDTVKKVVLNFVPGLAKVGEFIGDIVNSITDFVGVTSEADRAIERIKANADESLKLNKKFLDEHGSQLNEYTKQKIAAKNEYLELIKEDGANQVALGQELNRKLMAIDKKHADDLQKQRDEAEKKRLADEKDRKEKEKTRLENAEKERIRLALEARQKAIDLLTEQEEEQKRAKDELIDTSFEEAENKQDAHELAMASIKAKGRELDYDDQVATDAKALAQKKENQDLLLSQGEQLISNVAKLAGKNKAIQKAAIIAEGGVSLGKAVANTAEAVTRDLANGGAVFSAPLVALDLAVGATSVASIIQGTSKALQAVGGGSAPSAPSLPSAGGVNGAPQVGFQASSENQIATSISSANQALPPIKTFVVGSEVQTQIGLDAALVTENSFGG